MKTALRRSLQVVIALPLLAVLILWVRSYSVRDTIKRYEMWEEPTGKDSITSYLRLSELEFQAGGCNLTIRTEIDPTRGSPADVWKHELRWTEFWHESATAPKRFSYWTPPDVHWWNRLGFFWIHDSGRVPDATSTRYSRFIASPFWAIALLLAIPNALWIYGAIKRNRRKGKGHCRKCGYDLRATPDRCPECGTIPTRAS